MRTDIMIFKKTLKAAIVAMFLFAGAGAAYAGCSIEGTAGPDKRCNWNASASGGVSGGGSYSVNVSGSYPTSNAKNKCPLSSAQCSSLMSTFSGKVLAGQYSGSTPNGGCGNHYSWGGGVSCPSGSNYDAGARSCSPPPPPPDQCPNIDGYQGSVPGGMTRNSSGECHNPSSCPIGYVKDGNACEKPLSASCSLNGEPYFNESVGFEAVTTGGGSKTYKWAVVDPDAGNVVSKVDGKSSQSVNNVVLDVRGDHEVRVEVSTNGQRSEALCQFDVTDRPLSARCTSPVFTNVGQYTWQGTGAGGSQSGYTFAWKRNGATLGTGGSYSEAFTGYGNKSIDLVVTDSSSGETVTRTCAVAYGACASDSQCTTGEICRTDYTCGVPLPTISSIDMRPTLVNEGVACKLFWQSQNAVSCSIVLQNDMVFAENVATNNGSGYDVDPGTYKVRCFNSLGESIDSESKSCTLSGDTREN